MESGTSHEREIRAARNQSLFRDVNEKMRELRQAFATMTDTFTIACECADTDCIQMIEISPQDYLAVRAEPRHFAVLHGHVYPEVERVTRETDGFVVVEKEGAAADVVEALAPEAVT